MSNWQQYKIEKDRQLGLTVAAHDGSAAAPQGVGTAELVPTNSHCGSAAVPNEFLIRMPQNLLRNFSSSQRLIVLLAALWAAGFVGDCAAEPLDRSSPDLAEKYDVCIYAATPSGIYAAVAVAQEGKQPVLIEPSRWVGGMLGAGIKPMQDCPMPSSIGGLMGESLTELGDSPAEIRASFQKLLQAHDIPVLYEHRLTKVDKQDGRITAMLLENAPPDGWGVPAVRAGDQRLTKIAASVFIDASYEGDLMARAGVEYATGREPRSKYKEPHAGVQRPTNVTPIDPYVRRGVPDSGLLPMVEPDHGKPVGAGDDYTQAYNFRFYVTRDPKHRVAFTPPDDYDPADWELLGRYVEHRLEERPDSARLDRIFPGWLLRDGEYNYFREHLITMAPLGVSRHYQDGDYATRSRIWRDHIDYLRGLHHFMSTDERVPAAFRKEVAELGLDRRHHPETEGWPHQLYVRVCRRMVGRYVLTEHDVMNQTEVEDAVGLALYGVDTYPVRRIVLANEQRGEVAVATEGNMFIGGNRGTGVPYGVPFRAITPHREQCRNLLVPVCFSASYIAYASARMEPVFGVLGESAGVAAAQAVSEEQDVQEIQISRLQLRLRQRGQVLSREAAMSAREK